MYNYVSPFSLSSSHYHRYYSRNHSQYEFYYKHTLQTTLRYMFCWLTVKYFAQLGCCIFRHKIAVNRAAPLPQKYCIYWDIRTATVRSLLGIPKTLDMTAELLRVCCCGKIASGHHCPFVFHSPYISQIPSSFTRHRLA